MIVAAAIVLLWIASLIRLSAIGWRGDPATRYFATAGLFCASALTARALSVQFDNLVGEPNSYHLVQHLLLLAGGHQTANFIAALEPDRPATAVRKVLSSSRTLAALLVWTTLTWFLAPIHDGHLLDPITLHDMSFLLYIVPFSLYMAIVMISTAVFGLRQMSAIVAADPPPPGRRAAAASLILIDAGLLIAVLEPIAAIIWSVLPGISPSPTNVLRTGISPLMYFGGALIAAGMVVTMLVGSATQLVDDRRYIARLTPIWQDLVRHYPEARMPGPSAWSITRRTSLQLVRMRVELVDCMSRLRIDSSACLIDGELDNRALALAIRHALRGDLERPSVRAIDVLTIEPTPDQTPPTALLDLADAYAAIPAPAR